jgi:hypothetical protein
MGGMEPDELRQRPPQRVVPPAKAVDEQAGGDDVVHHSLDEPGIRVVGVPRKG